MSKTFNQPQLKTRTALLLFLKTQSAPLVLYFENPQEEYEFFQSVMTSTTAKMIEKTTAGPIKKVSVLSNQIACVALQEETYV